MRLWHDHWPKPRRRERGPVQKLRGSPGTRSVSEHPASVRGTWGSETRPGVVLDMLKAGVDERLFVDRHGLFQHDTDAVVRQIVFDEFQTALRQTVQLIFASTLEDLDSIEQCQR